MKLRREFTREELVPMHGLCGHCGIDVDNYDPNHRITPILDGGHGVECVLRGELEPGDAAPLGKRPREEHAG